MVLKRGSRPSPVPALVRRRRSVGFLRVLRCVAGIRQRNDALRPSGFAPQSDVDGRSGHAASGGAVPHRKLRHAREKVLGGEHGKAHGDPARVGEQRVVAEPGAIGCVTDRLRGGEATPHPGHPLPAGGPHRGFNEIVQKERQYHMQLRTAIEQRFGKEDVCT
jgi:hypothetical protein